MDASTEGRVVRRKHKFLRAADCDDLFFKYSISVIYTMKEVKRLLKRNEAEIVKKPPKDSLLYELKVTDKITYVKLGEPIIRPPQLVLCSHIAACRKCKELFAYDTRQQILNFYKTHKCRVPSNVKIINTCKSSGNIDASKNGSRICSTNMCEPPKHIMNTSVVQDINRSGLSICSIRQEDNTEMDIQNYEKNEEGVVANPEESMNNIDSVVMDESTENENVDLGTIGNITDDCIEESAANITVTESGHEADNSINIEGVSIKEKHMTLLNLYDKLDNPFESVVVTDLYNYNLILTMNEFYKAGRFTDASVVCENQKIECHRLVLSMFSAHFEEVFRECYTNCAAAVIEGLKFWQVKALIDYMYTSKVNVDEKDWTLLMEAADKLQFRDYLRPKKLPRDTAKKHLCM